MNPGYLPSSGITAVAAAGEILQVYLGALCGSKDALRVFEASLNDA